MLQLQPLSTQDNAKLLEQLKPGFKRTIDWNKYQLKISTERPNQYLDHLIDLTYLIDYLLNRLLLYCLTIMNTGQVTIDIIFRL